MDKTSILAKQLEDDLIERFGTLLGSSALAKTLGHSSVTALRQSIARNTVPVTVFKLPKRRGYFAFAKDVAVWLAQQYELSHV
jgi:hypothetical protein